MSISVVTSECWCDCSGSSFPEVPKISFSFWWHCFFYPGLCFFVVVVVIVYFPKWALSKTKYMYVVPSSGSGEFQSGWTGRDALYVCVCTESLLGEKEMEPLGFVFDFSAYRGTFVRSTLTVLFSAGGHAMVSCVFLLPVSSRELLLLLASSLLLLSSSPLSSYFTHNVSFPLVHPVKLLLPSLYRGGSFGSERRTRRSGGQN